ncbi:MAG: hypothetical protein ABSD20_17480 [Terriglobales bacterium]|jgi:hypothetical protein
MSILCVCQANLGNPGQYLREIEANNAQYDEFTRQMQANQLNDNLRSINTTLQQLDWRLWDQFSRPGR